MVEETQYPVSVAVSSLPDDPEVVAAQVISVAKTFPRRIREFILDAAREVGKVHCEHTNEPIALSGGLFATQRREAASAHDGLCGVFHAETIAGVTTEDVADRGQLTGNRFRNQACFEAAMNLNARGGGVQLKRGKCFTEACRAVSPGNGDLHPAVVAALSKDFRGIPASELVAA